MTFRSLLFCVLGSLFVASPLVAQVPQRRITRPITEADRVTLPGSRAPRLASATDLGALPADSPLSGITLVFKRSAEQQSDLQQLLADQQNPSSPQYRQWLTPDAFAARFGMADADLQSTHAWLTSRGLHLDPVPPSRDRLTFSGTAAQVAAAFGTELHHYRLDDEVHFAPASELSLPGALVPVTAAVLHLSDIRPKPNLKLAAQPAPAYNTASGAHVLGPTDLIQMYDAQPSPTSTNAAGNHTSIAVVGQSYVDINGSINTFSGSYDLPLSQLTPVLVPGTGVEGYSIGDESESELDVEYASGIARLAKVYFVHVGTSPNHDVFDALAYAIQFNIAPVLSFSYSICEPLLSATDLDQFNAVLMQAAAQGQTVVVAAGDSGSTACTNYTTTNGITAAQQTALAVSFPADSPYVTAVGGTQMLAGTFAAGANTYWAASAGNTYNQTLLSYVPEVVWNEGSPTRGILAGGGGSSTHFPRPSWQAGVPGIPSGTFRLLPDVSLQASVQSPGFIFCTTDPGVVGPTGQNSCGLPLGLSGSKGSIGGGTSFAAPTFAGFIATLNGLQGVQGQGLLNPILYSLASQPAINASAFHDITSGSIACVSGTPNCTPVGQSGYSAGQGFDQASGLGSIDFNNLVAAWPAPPAGFRQAPVFTLGSGGSMLPPGSQAVEYISLVPANYGPNNPNPPAPTGPLTIALDGVVLTSAATFTVNPFGGRRPSTISTRYLPRLEDISSRWHTAETPYTHPRAPSMRSVSATCRPPEASPSPPPTSRSQTAPAAPPRSLSRPTTGTTAGSCGHSASQPAQPQAHPSAPATNSPRRP